MNNKNSKIKLYIVITTLLVILVMSGVAILADEYHSHRVSNNVSRVAALLNEAIENSSKDSNKPKINVINTSTSTVKINTNVKTESSSNTKTNTYYVEPQVQIQPETQKQTPYTETDEYKEWKADFDKRWDEMGDKIDQNNKELEESQKKFCEDNPNLCN